MTAHGKRGSPPFHSLASELARRRRRSRESDGFSEGAAIWPEKEESFLRSPLPSPPPRTLFYCLPALHQIGL